MSDRIWYEDFPGRASAGVKRFAVRFCWDGSVVEASCGDAAGRRVVEDAMGAGPWRMDAGYLGPAQGWAAWFRKRVLASYGGDGVSIGRRIDMERARSAIRRGRSRDAERELCFGPKRSGYLRGARSDRLNGAARRTEAAKVSGAHGCMGREEKA